MVPARRHDHLPGELAAPVIFGYTRGVPVQFDEGPHALQGGAVIVNCEGLAGGAAGMPGDEHPSRNGGGDEVRGPLADLIFSGERRRAVLPIVRYVSARKLEQAVEAGRLQFPQLIRGKMLGVYERAQIFLEYPAIAPTVIFGALGRSAYVLQRDRQRGVELLQHFWWMLLK